MTTVEHALPVSRLYRDVLTLYAMSGTGATPTHIVNYGGVMAEQLVWAKYDVPDDPKYFPQNNLFTYRRLTSYSQIATVYKTRHLRGVD